jgi:hypothetical protein
VTLIRTTTEENSRIGEEIGRKVAASTGPATIMLPLEGVSATDAAGQDFDNSNVRRALFDAVRQHHEHTELVELQHHFDDPEFTESAARGLLQLRSKMSVKTVGTVLRSAEWVADRAKHPPRQLLFRRSSAFIAGMPQSQ